MMTSRACGVLLHISSLPSEHGIGDMGSAAYDFVDRLVEAGQSYWQILPLSPSNPTSGESPYFSSSAFAGNPLFIDLNTLLEEGLIDLSDIVSPEKLPFTEIDYTQVRDFKLTVLYKACESFVARADNSSFEQFCQAHDWLDDYALFTALQKRENAESWSQWPARLRNRDPEAIANARRDLRKEIHNEKVLQYFFFQQWEKLKAYANNKGIMIFGDMPIYVAYESADVWIDSQFFKLNEQKHPTAVSGVPPDYFSATGQLWNNPVYNWDALKQTDYTWWIKRMAALFERFDIVRIDHFRGLVQFWEVPAGEKTAINGSWKNVPTYEFFDCLIKAFPSFPVVVEDLGIITPDVVEVKNHYDLPGMLILQFAFGEDDPNNPYLPANHSQNAVVYLGTHDNNTALSWYQNEVDETTKTRISKYINHSESASDAVDKLIELTLASPSNIAIVTIQDLLRLPGRARINDPSTSLGNWKWRLTRTEFDAIPFGKLAKLTQKYHRVRQ